MSRVRDEKLYGRWNMMKQRCFNPNNNKYKNYGERGITICKEWLSYKNFKCWAYKNGFNNNLTLDRIDVNGNYEPSNCRWADQKTQQNNRRDNVYFNHEDSELTYNELSKMTGLSRKTIEARVKYGYTIDEILSQKINNHFILIKYKGKEMNLSSWCEVLNLPYKTIHARIKRGWSPELALETPVRKGNYK